MRPASSPRRVPAPFAPAAVALASLMSTSLAAQASDTITLAPVVVTATRVPVSQNALAAAVTVISGEAIRARGIRSVADVLRATVGVAVVETGSFGGQTSLFLRGGESDYVKVLLDGVPLNQPGGSIDLADLTTDNVERIEIVPGPASVLYGSDAVTGVVQIFTRAGSGRPRVSAAARGGTYGATELDVAASGGTALLRYGVTASRFASDGLYRVNNGYRNTIVAGRVRLAPDPRTDASLVYRHGDDVYHFPTNSAGEPVDSNQSSAERGPLFSLEVARRLSPAVELRGLGTWRETRSRFDDDPDSPGEDGSFHSRDLTRRAGGGALLNWRVREGASVAAGVEYEDERQDGRSVFSASFGTFPDSIRVRRWNRATYAQALLGVGGPLAVQLGARLDDNSRFGRHATYRVGASYRVGRETRLRGAVGTGFKEPTFFENFARGSVRGNPNLKPERSTSWEAGAERTLLGGRLSFAATYFNQEFRDLVEFTFTPPPPDSVNYFNVAGASADGVEAKVALSLGAGVTAALGYTYLRTRVGDPGFDTSPDALFRRGERLLRRPTHALVQEVAVPLGSRGTVTAATRFVGDRDDLDYSRAPGERRVRLHPYAKLDIAGEYRVLGDEPGRVRVVLTTRIENALADDAGEIANFRARGRTLLVGARVGAGL